MKKQVKIILAVLIAVGVGIASISTIFWIIMNQNGLNEAPIILNYYPTTNPSINETHEQEFNVTAYDPNGDIFYGHNKTNR